MPTLNFCITAALYFILAFTPFAFATTEIWSSTVFELSVVLLVSLWFTKVFITRHFEFVKSPATPFILAFIVLIVYQLVLPLTGYYNATKFELFKVLAYVSIFYVVLNNVTSREKIDRIIAFMMLVGFCLALVAILQKLSGTDRLLWMRAAPNTSREMMGPFVNKNHFSAYMEMLIPLSLGFCFARQKRLFESGAWFLALFAVAVMAFSLLIAGSRAGVVCFALSMLLFFAISFFKKTIRGKFLFIALLLGAVCVMVLWLGREPVSTEIRSMDNISEGMSYKTRVSVWKSSLKMIAEYKFMGAGIGAFGNIFPKYQSADVRKHITHAHNDYLEALAETGLVGFLLLSLGIAFWLVPLARKLYYRHDPYALNLIAGALSSVFAIFLHSFVDFSLKIPADAVLLTVITALAPVVAGTKIREGHETLTLDYDVYRLRKYRQFLQLAGLIIIALYSRWLLMPFIADTYAHRGELSSSKSSAVIASPSVRARQSDSSASSDDSAFKYLSLAISYNPMDADYHYRLANLCYAEFPKTINPSTFFRALEEYRTALNLDFHNSRYWQTYAWVYANLSKFQGYYDSEVIASPSIGTKQSIPSSSSFDPKLSSYAYKAEKYFRNAIKNEPNNPYPHRALAQYCFRVADSLLPLSFRGEGRGEGGRHPEWSSSTKDLVTNVSSPRSSAPSTLLFSHYLSLAVSSYRNAIAIDNSMLNEGINQYSKYTTRYNDLALLVPDTHQAHYDFGIYLRNKGQTELGKEEIEIAIELLIGRLRKNSRDAEAHFIIGDYAYYGLRDTKLAISETESAIQLEPGELSYRYWYAQMLINMDRNADASVHLDYILAHDPKTQATQKLLHATLLLRQNIRQKQINNSLGHK